MKLDFDRIPKARSGAYGVKYVIFNKTDKKLAKTIDEAVARYSYIYGGYAGKETHVCFSQLISNIGTFINKEKAIPNRILFEADFNRTPETALTKEVLVWWVEKCKKHGLLPKYTGKHYIETGNFLLRIEELDKKQIYMHLTTARIPQETPGIATVVHYLVEDKGFDFFVALALSHYLQNTNAGHSLLPISFPYKFNGGFRENQINIDLSTTHALYKFINNHKPKQRVKDLSLKNNLLGNQTYSEFGLHDTLEEIARKEKSSTDLLNLNDLAKLKIAK